MNSFIGVVIISIIILIACFIAYIETVFVDKLQKSENDNSKILKILQEIACDYRVRIIRSGKGNVSEDPIIESCFGEKECIYMGVKNNVNASFEFTDSGTKYLINFRVFGKCYLAHTDSEITAWAIVISKAREESRNIFGRTGYLDKHKIQ